MANRISGLLDKLEARFTSKPPAPAGAALLSRETRALLEKHRDEMLSLGEILSTDGYAVLGRELLALEVAAVEQVLAGNKVQFPRRSGVVAGVRSAQDSVKRILVRGAEAQRRLHADDEARAAATERTVVRT